jgi:hypothetical protein
MKNVILLAATLIGFIALSSCQKDKAVNSPNANTTVNRAANTAEKKPIIIFGPDRYRIWVVNTAECVFTGGNCLDDVIIISKSVSSLMSIIGHGGNYRDFISSNMEDLSADIPDDYLQEVVNGKYTLSIRSNQETNKDYLLFDNDEETVLVIPFNK